MKQAIFHFVILLATKYTMGDDGGTLCRGNYYQTYGGDHLKVLDQGNEVQLVMDKTTGAGFSSKSEFGSGYFGINIKIPSKNSSGINTSFYLMAVPWGKPVIGVNHYEFDFEFFGTNGNPHMLSTNVFANNQGGKEQLFHLWFDPTIAFHKYDLLWNEHQIVWFVDGTPIRVWKNNTNLAVKFPMVAMHLEASIWNPSWLGRVDWTQAPFTANYRGFAIDGCRYQPSRGCSSAAYYWNQKQFWQLSPDQRNKMQNIRKRYMYEDYCNDKKRAGPECRANS